MSEVVIVESPAVQAPVVTPATKRDVFHRAADLLEEFGHCRFAPARDEHAARVSVFSNRVDSFCLAGAITRAADDLGYPLQSTREFLDAHRYADTYLTDKLLGVFQAFKWNDAPGRTKAEVVARLREAAERSEHE